MNKVPLLKNNMPLLLHLQLVFRAFLCIESCWMPISIKRCIRNRATSRECWAVPQKMPPRSPRYWYLGTRAAWHSLRCWVCLRWPISRIVSSITWPPWWASSLLPQAGASTVRFWVSDTNHKRSREHHRPRLFKFNLRRQQIFHFSLFIFHLESAFLAGAVCLGPVSTSDTAKRSWGMALICAAVSRWITTGTSILGRNAVRPANSTFTPSMRGEIWPPVGPILNFITRYNISLANVHKKVDNSAFSEHFSWEKFVLSDFISIFATIMYNP